MKEFRGSITDITYSSDVVPPCLLHAVGGGFGHLDRLEPLTTEGANNPVFQEKATMVSKARSKVKSAFAAAAQASLKQEDREDFDANLSAGTMREVGREMRDVGAMSAEMGKMVVNGSKKIAREVGEMIVEGAIEQVLVAAGAMPEE